MRRAAALQAIEQHCGRILERRRRSWAFFVIRRGPEQRAPKGWAATGLVRSLAGTRHGARQRTIEMRAALDKCSGQESV